jgi:hypothetical protein
MVYRFFKGLNQYKGIVKIEPFTNRKQVVTFL